MAETVVLLAPYLAAASAGISAVSSIMGGFQQSNAAEAQAAADRRNAAQSRVNAGVALNASEAEAQRSEQQTRRRAASAANQLGASGVDPGFGSPLDVLADISAEGALDTQIQRWKGTNSARGYLDQGQQYDTQAAVAQDKAGDYITGGFISAGTSLLGGAARYGSMQMRMGSTYGQTGSGLAPR
ncbi:MAG: hypothetical protein ACKVQR_04370 [Aquabacterium sp.]